MIPKMSVLADCNADSVVVRVPHELFAKMVVNLPEDEEKEELLKWCMYAIGRSQKLRVIFEDYGIFN